MDSLAAGTFGGVSGTDVPRRIHRAFRVRGSGSDQLLILKPRTPFRFLITDGLYVRLYVAAGGSRAGLRMLAVSVPTAGVTFVW